MTDFLKNVSYKGTEVVKALVIDASVHRVLEVVVDVNSTKKAEGLQIKVPFKAFTPDTVVVNEVKKTIIAEGVETLVVNGGKSKSGAALHFAPKSKFPGGMDEISIADGASTWTDNYEHAYNVCTMGNNAELTRISALMEDLMKQHDFIVNVQENNKRAYNAYIESKR